MTTGTFSAPISDRYFEDYEEGAVYRFGTVEVKQDEVIEFGKKYDPQVFHTDPVGARTTSFGGLIASGWHTAGMMMRLYCENYLTQVASLGSPGLDELRWPRPVRPGDRLSVRVTVLSKTPSRSKPDRGVITSFIEVLNQEDAVVMSAKTVNMIGRRSPGAPAGDGPGA